MTPVKRMWSETRSPMLQTGNMVVRFFGVAGTKMAKCVRKNCSEQVSPIAEATTKRLCEKHYQRFCELTLRKENNVKYQINKMLPRRIKRPKKGRVYYSHPSVKPKYISKKSDIEKAGFKKDAWVKIKAILKTPAWRNVETRIRRNREEYNLPLELDDVLELYRLYSWVDFCKKSNLYSSEFLNKTDINIKLQVCTFPNAESGHSAPGDSLMTLPLILKNKVNKHRILNRNIPIKNTQQKFKSLYKILVEKFGISSAAENLLHLPITSPIHPYQFRVDTQTLSLKRTPPLFGLLFNELKRLKITGLIEKFKNTHTANIHRPFSLEILAIYLLFNLMRGGMEEIYYYMTNNIDDKGSFHAWAISAFIQKDLNITDDQGLIDLYNSFFTHKVVSYSKKEKCVLWVNGQKETLSMGPE